MMEEPELPKKHEYSKSEAIALYSFFFVCVTFSVTILSIMCNILPQHYIMHTLIQGLIYGITYRAIKYIVSNGITFDNNHSMSDGFNMSKSISDDMSYGSYSRDSMSSSSVTSSQARMVRDIW